MRMGASEFKIIFDGKKIGLQELESVEKVEANLVDGIKIVVQNAKATKGRSRGEFRTLLFQNLHPRK